MATLPATAIVAAFSDAVWRKRDLDAIDRYFGDDYEDPEITGEPRAGLKQFFSAYFAARPDFQLTAEDYITEGDRVVQVISGEFTNTDEPAPPSA
ncbi:MAG: ester cyclase [Chloroflexota bacterium]|nr:ester cyclase [Dehalococcoidia bacterium]MDW8253924.1 ester cyclase [Chloroflexota bacterium]